MKKIISTILATSFISPISFGAYFNHSDSWSSSQAPSPSAYTYKVLEEAPAPKYSLDQILTDPDQLLPEEFRVSPALRKITKFWLSIYTQYGSKQTVVFDETHPEIIYEVLDFTDLEKRARNRIAYEIMRERKIKKVIAEYESTFRKLAQRGRIKGKRKKQTDTEKNILAAISRLDHKHSWKDLEKNLKLQTGQKDALAEGLAQWEPFEKKVETIFKAVGVPAELARLSLVESSFNLKATSKVGAVGVWQFMESSGKHFLKIAPEHGIDERRSPIKSAVAAARMLKQNYRGLKSWPFAVIAYNSGMKKIIRNSSDLIEDRGLSEVIRLCKGPRGLGWAGKNYFPEFLAMLHAEKYRNQFFKFYSPRPIQGIAFVSAGKESLVEYALRNKLDPVSVIGLNPDIKSPHKKIPKGTLIAIPEKTDRLHLLLSSDSGKKRNHSG